MLCLYGPFKVGGEFIGADGGEGNRNFDEKVRQSEGGWTGWSEATAAYHPQLKGGVKRK